MSKNKFFQTVAISIIVSLILSYLSSAFILNELDFTKWTEFNRGKLLVKAIGAAVIYNGIYAMLKNMEPC
jgi:hypothetical protein